ncbi:MAG TPA: heme exporter protein CcmD [Allosphingosinicella sp.]|nr:heme exporter protein CcmD [Allosphingosinicella sp.]
MNPWPFVIGAYALTIFLTVGLVGWSLSAMRQAEKQAEALGRRP